jgi:hypothetical protein
MALSKTSRKALPIEVSGTPKMPLGMTPAQFLRDYWQKRPLLIRNAFPNFQSPVAPEDLAGLACEEAALSRLIQHDENRERWHVKTGPLAKAILRKPAMRTGRCWCRTSTSGIWMAPHCSIISAFCQLGAWTM